MPEIKPDLTDQSRCISVHWSLPVQCVLPRTHRENWHEAWHPKSGNRIRYRRSMGVFRTEELESGEWTALAIPPPSEIVAELEAKVRQLTEDRDRARDAFSEAGRSAMDVSGHLEDGINTEYLHWAAERDGLLAALTAAEADRDRARDAAVALEQENARVRAMDGGEAP